MGLKYHIENGVVTIISHTDRSAKSITIPEFIDGLPVTHIRYFGYLNSVEKLVIPISVTHIDSTAFEYCLFLKSINNNEIQNGFCLINNRFVMFNRFIYSIKHQISEDYACNIRDNERLFINNIK